MAVWRTFNIYGIFSLHVQKKRKCFFKFLKLYLHLEKWFIEKCVLGNQNNNTAVKTPYWNLYF